MDTVRKIMEQDPAAAMAMGSVEERFQAMTEIAANAAACVACADACLSEEMVGNLVQCIKLNEDCADVCSVTARTLARTGSGEQLMTAQLEACAEACAACGSECERHASMHEHCRLCAESCRAAEDACLRMLKPVAV